MSPISLPIALLTDFGIGSPYVGQLRLVIDSLSLGHGCVELISDLPAFRPDLAAYLISALVRSSPSPCVHACVVDPGVGSERAALVLKADENWLVGPDNGLLAIAARHARDTRWWIIDWRPERLSRSFHGRDLFAPVATQLALGQSPDMTPIEGDTLVGAEWPDDLPQVIYRDHYGNLCTGQRAASLPLQMDSILAAGRRLQRRGTFYEAEPGQPFWFENSFGLVELAVNQGRADEALGLSVGDSLDFV